MKRNWGHNVKMFMAEWTLDDYLYNHRIIRANNKKVKSVLIMVS